MAGYADTRQMIINTLMGRLAGTEIQPEEHQKFALQITDYVRSVELVAGNATPIGFANASTVPVQPDNGQAVYLSSVGGAQTVTFANFIGQNGNAISVTSTDNVVKLVTLLWNGQYWSSQVTSVNAIRDTTNGYLFMGVATPSTDPGTPDQKVFYMGSSGTYSNFGSQTIKVENGDFVIFSYDTAWHYKIFESGTVGFPYLFPTSGQYTSQVLNHTGELYLDGIDNSLKYYIAFNKTGNDKFIQIFDATQSTIVAQGLGQNAVDNVVYLDTKNNSGIKGFFYYKGNLDDFVGEPSIKILISNVGAANIIESPKISKAINFLNYLSFSGYNQPYVGRIDGLYIEDINPNQSYKIKVLYNSTEQYQLFQLIDQNNNTIAQGVRYSANQKQIELFKITGYNVYGVIEFNGALNFNISNGVQINVAKAVDISNSLNIRLFVENNPITVGKTSGYYQYSSLLKAVIKATQLKDKKIIIANGTYDLEEEFEEYYGTDYFDNFVHSSDGDGILLKNRVHLIGSSKTDIVFNYSGSNNAVKQWFSPFCVELGGNSSYGFTLENINIIAANCRYCVHDDRGAGTEAYINKYINCTMSIDNSNNSLGYHVCIGGGLGRNGYIEIRGCKFESKGGYNIGNPLASYHNSVDSIAKSQIIATNNYFVGLGTFKFTWYGTSPLITNILVSNNYIGSPIVVRGETVDSTVKNINVIEWNNKNNDVKFEFAKRNISVYNEIDEDKAIKAYIANNTGVITETVSTYRIVKVYLTSGNYYVKTNNPGTQQGCWKYSDDSYETPLEQIWGNEAKDGIVSFTDGYYAICYSAIDNVSNYATFPIICRNVLGVQTWELPSNIERPNFIQPTYLLTKSKMSISFIFDDGEIEDVEIKKVFDKYNLKCGFAIISGDNRYLDYAKEGYEILAHGNTPLVSADEQTIRAAMISGKKVVTDMGLICHGWVTPSSQLPTELSHVTSDYFEYGYTVFKGTTSSGQTMDSSMKSYNLWRCHIRTFLDNYTTIISDAVANNGMLCIYGHGYEIETIDSYHWTLTELDSLLSYLTNNKIDILTPYKSCLKLFDKRH